MTILSTVLIGAGVIGLFAWSPWTKPSETEWLTTYQAWSTRIEASLQHRHTVDRAACESTFDDDVGDPPQKKLQPVAAAARRRCAALTAAGWQGAQADVVRALVVAHSARVPPRNRPDVSKVVRSQLGVEADVYCWPPEAWATLSEPYALLRGGSVARRHRRSREEPHRPRPDGVCRAQSLSATDSSGRAEHENLELAESLVVLAHHAEHLRSPSASEQEVECYAVQDVRPLVSAAGWGDSFANKIARHAWELAYAELLARFRTPLCSDDRVLDLNPHSHAWP